MNAPRAVLDTSALYSPRHRRELQINAALGTFVGFWSPWIIAELTRVLTWRWAAQNGSSLTQQRICGESCNTMMTVLLSTFQLVNPVPPYPLAWPRLSDQWDVPIWAAAKDAAAHYVVSENIHDFPPQDISGHYRWEGIEYIRTATFLQLLVGDPAED